MPLIFRWLFGEKIAPLNLISVATLGIVDASKSCTVWNGQECTLGDFTHFVNIFCLFSAIWGSLSVVVRSNLHCFHVFQMLP